MVGINKPCCNRFKQSSLFPSDPTTKKSSIQTLTLSLIRLTRCTQYQFIKHLKQYKANDYIRQKGGTFLLQGENIQTCTYVQKNINQVELSAREHFCCLWLSAKCQFPQLASNFPPLLPFHGDQVYFGSPLVLNWGPYLVPKPFSVLTMFRYSYLLWQICCCLCPSLPPPLGEGLIGPLINPYRPTISQIWPREGGGEGEVALVLQQGRVRPKIASN